MTLDTTMTIAEKRKISTGPQMRSRYRPANGRVTIEMTNCTLGSMEGR